MGAGWILQLLGQGGPGRARVMRVCLWWLQPLPRTPCPPPALSQAAQFLSRVGSLDAKPGMPVMRGGRGAATRRGREGAGGRRALFPGNRKAWQPTPVFLTGESRGQRRLADYSPWGPKESDTTEKTACTFARHGLEISLQATPTRDTSILIFLG